MYNLYHQDEEDQEAHEDNDEEMTEKYDRSSN